jgi:hypothetical protein
MTVRRPAREGLHDVAGVLDAAVGDDRARRACDRTAAQSRMAVTCGTPTPATTRVVQIEPGPMPTLTASAPASMSASRRFGGGDVAGDELDVRVGLLELAHGSRTPLLWPWAVSTTMTSTPASNEGLMPASAVGADP